jgi:glycosyltransferase involved in cell wall biosynthesis
MKVLFLTKQINEKSGWGRYSSELIHEIVNQNTECFVACQTRSPDVDIKQYELMPNAESPKRCFLLSPIYALIIFLKIPAKEKPDIIHCHIEVYSLVAFFLSLLFRVRYVLTMHGSYAVRYLLDTYKFFQVFTYRKAAKIICVSMYTFNQIKKYHPFDNMCVIHNGVTPGTISVVDNLFKTKENILLTVGALKTRKGVDKVLNSLPLVKDKVGNFTYYLVGDQSDKLYYEELQKVVKDNNLTENVVFKGLIKETELQDLYRKAKVFILTPVSDRDNFEGFGLVYLEANINGIPVIGSYGNGGEDAINDGKTGFLVNVNDSEDIASRIVELFENEDLYNEMSKHSLQWADDHLWNKIALEYQEIYIKNS